MTGGGTPSKTPSGWLKSRADHPAEAEQQRIVRPLARLRPPKTAAGAPPGSRHQDCATALKSTVATAPSTTVNRYCTGRYRDRFPGPETRQS